MKLPRAEYPRPQFYRKEWTNLNGEWDFSFDRDVFDKKIIVPFAYQSQMSGINSKEPHDVVWYRRFFEINEEWKEKIILLHFGAVDYECDVWVNEVHIGHHIGGHSSFSFDITAALKSGANSVTLKVTDKVTDLEMPRGKQYWKDGLESIFYTRTTGIWQTVWIEAVNMVHITKTKITPDLDHKSVFIEYEIFGSGSRNLEIEIYFRNKKVTDLLLKDCKDHGEIKIDLDQRILKKWNFQEELTWSPEKPRLFNVYFTIWQDEIRKDYVESYFGMRKISIENGKILLNNRLYYQKLILDQGYWKESLMTAPSDDAFIYDIEAAKKMGFNGARKHQKIEDPRYLYHADVLGFLVWGEIASAYIYSDKYVERITGEWIEMLERDYNHPCIVAWTPLNESWGVPNISCNTNEQAHSAAMVYLTKSLDQTRPVISNDGWEHTCTDILSIHDYEADEDILRERYKNKDCILKSSPAGRKIFADGWNYAGQPIMLTEFGGISYSSERQEGWGYSNAVSGEEFIEKYGSIVTSILDSEEVQGFCYTQLTDIEQEINGLMTYDRKPKVPFEKIKEINDGMWRRIGCKEMKE